MFVVFLLHYSGICGNVGASVQRFHVYGFDFVRYFTRLVRYCSINPANPTALTEKGKASITGDTVHLSAMHDRLKYPSSCSHTPCNNQLFLSSPHRWYKASDLCIPDALLEYKWEDNDTETPSAMTQLHRILRKFATWSKDIFCKIWTPDCAQK